MQNVVQPHDVISSMSFIKPDSKINRRYITPGLEVNTGKYEVKNVHIRDARLYRTECTLETTGFQLSEHASEVTDFTDTEQIEKIYAIEMRHFVKELTGADKVIMYAPIVRQATATQGAEAQPPAGDVHVDFNSTQASIVASALLPPEDKDYKYTRFLHLSNWRAFSPGPQDWPLGVVNSRSVRDDEGLVNTAIYQNEPPPEDLENLPDIPEGTRTGDAFVFPYNGNFEWNYFSCMTKDEVLSFKLNDSDHERTWRTPHCSFKNDGEGCHPRESIEIRSCCYFE